MSARPEQTGTEQAGYDVHATEAKWLPIWDDLQPFRADDASEREKRYALTMFPYPSGDLHMGHAEVTALHDVLARYWWLKGYEVLNPMGWDSFGLPAENAAFRNNEHPATYTYGNIETQFESFKKYGISFDWSRRIHTSDPEYYKWTQWLFLKFRERGLAYRKDSPVNWCPNDQTVLANEQVVDGKCERCGAEVTKRELNQWYFKITEYAQELLDDLDTLQDSWPDRVVTAQRNWIGRSVGAHVDFDLELADGSTRKVTVYTTRPDTLYGATFMVVAADAALASEIVAPGQKAALEQYLEDVRKASDIDRLSTERPKTGVDLGIVALNPVNGERIPVWASDYVLADYGTGAIMAVPAHDQRDLDFAKAMGLPVRTVIDVAGAENPEESGVATPGDGTYVNSGPLNGLTDKAAGIAATIEQLEKDGRGAGAVNFRLRDWLLSRQRYWGCPIPVIHCEACGVVPVPAKDLPVRLPEDVEFDRPGNPLDRHPSFTKCTCPTCGKPARRETDTMDTFVDSSWYYTRFTEPRAQTPTVPEVANAWLPVDQYIGGIEHAILHLLYARFWTKVMRDLGLVKVDEPFTKLLTQGMVLNHIYSRRNEKGGKEYFWPHDVEHVLGDDGKVIGAKLKNAVGDLPVGTPIDYEGVGTMSKSKNNGVDPQDLIEKYGADTARLYTMFTAPPEATLEWNDAAVEGSYRFLRRVWNFGVKLSAMDMGAATASVASASSLKDVEFGKEAKALRLEIHTVLKQVDYDYQRMQYNTVVSGAMKMINALEDFKATESAGAQVALIEGFGILLRVLYPATPHITHSLWSSLGYANHLGDLLDAAWPQVDAGALVQDEIELMLQVNGKLRGSIHVPAAADKAEIERIALASEAFALHGGGAGIKRVIIVPGRLVNVVI